VLLHQNFAQFATTNKAILKLDKKTIKTHLKSVQKYA